MTQAKNIQWEYIGLLFLACFPIFPFFLVSVGIGVYAVFALLERFLNKSHTKNYVFNNRFFVIQIAFFLVLAFISFFNDGISSTLKYLEPSLSLLIFPIIWFISKTRITVKQRQNVLKTFTVSSLLLGFYFVGFSLFYAIKNNLSFRIFHKEVPVLDVHPHYSGLFFFISIVFLWLQFHPKKPLLKAFKYLGIVFFTCLILLMASRAIFICLVLFFIIEFFRSKINLQQKLAVLITAAVLMFAAVSFIKPLQIKLNNISTTEKFELPYKKWPTSTQIRIGLNHCALQTIKENSFLGTGVVSFEDKLNSCYDKFKNSEKVRYNSHNYYFLLLGAGGIFCVVFFLFMLYKHASLAFVNNNLFYGYFLMSIVISLLTENILSRVYGVVFMLFFMTIFVKTTNISTPKK